MNAPDRPTDALCEELAAALTDSLPHWRLRNLTPGAVPYVLARAAACAERPFLVVTAHARDAEEVVVGLQTMLGERALSGYLARRVHLFVDPLLGFLTHKEPKIRECTAAALGKLRDSRAVDALIAALNDTEVRVRWYAADSLGKIGNPLCVDSLIKLLSDTSARVRESAVTALGQIGNQQAIESLIKALQDVDKRVAEQAAESLVNIK